MREVAREHPDPLVEHRDQKRLLGGEVPVERLVREPRLPDHLADARLEVVVAPDQDEGGLEQPADLFGIRVPSPASARSTARVARDSGPAGCQNLVLHSGNDILRTG